MGVRSRCSHSKAPNFVLLRSRHKSCPIAHPDLTFSAWNGMRGSLVMWDLVTGTEIGDASGIGHATERHDKKHQKKMRQIA